MVQRVVVRFPFMNMGVKCYLKKISSGTAAVMSVPGRFLLRWAAKGLFFVF